MNILIVEDEVIVGEDLNQRLLDFGYETAGIAVSGRQAITLAGKAKPDLVLMDIQLKGNLDGIEAATEIWGKFRIPVVFLSSHSEGKQLELAKSAEPFGYLVKPIRDEVLKSTIEMALNRSRINGVGGEAQVEANLSPSNGRRKDFFFIKQGAVFQKVMYREILWIQAIKDYIKIKTEDSVYYHRATIKSIALRLADHDFIRVHKSYIIPLERIDSIEENTISLANKLIPIGRAYRVDLMKRLDFI